MKFRVMSLSILILLILWSFSHAQIGLNLGTEYGFGLMIQAGSPAVKVEIGGGLTPLFVYWQIEDIFGSNDQDYYKLYLSGTVGAKLNLALKNPNKDRLGLKFGASYDTIMKMGFGGGLDYRISKKPKNIVISGGVMIYPDAYDELLDRLNEEENTDYSKDDLYSALVSLRPFVSLTLYH